jgi:hypothetical protein
MRPRLLGAEGIARVGVIHTLEDVRCGEN